MFHLHLNPLGGFPTRFQQFGNPKQQTKLEQKIIGVIKPAGKESVIHDSRPESEKKEEEDKKKKNLNETKKKKRRTKGDYVEFKI